MSLAPAVDIVVAERAAPGPRRGRGLGELDEGERILDAGPRTVERLTAAMDEARTLIWNGPLGVFEPHPSTRARPPLRDTRRRCAGMAD